MELAKSFSILDYNSLRTWSKTSREFWSDKKNIQASRDRMNVRKNMQKQLRDPNFLKKLEQEFRNRAINDNLSPGTINSDKPATL
jgi:hypothetical protein